jgi:diacylglycerol kinase family enzyme
VLERVLRDSQPIGCELQLDDVHLSGEYLLVEILNFGLAGPNLRLAPEADAADGILDVVLIEARERDRLEEHLALVRTDPANAPTLPVRHARHVTLRCQPCAAHLDDELWPGPGGRSSFVTDVNVTPAAITFLVPPRAASGGTGED